MQTLKLTYGQNHVGETLALIFVNTELKGDGKTYKYYGDEIVSENLTYDDAEARAGTARKTFNMLEFD